jgi:hypothetical protein
MSDNSIRMNGESIVDWFKEHPEDRESVMRGIEEARNNQFTKTPPEITPWDSEKDKNA